MSGRESEGPPQVQFETWCTWNERGLHAEEVI
jgi:hypothetical protein